MRHEHGVPIADSLRGVKVHEGRGMLGFPFQARGRGFVSQPKGFFLHSQAVLGFEY